MDDSEVMSVLIDDVSTDSSISQFSLDNVGGFELASCSQHKSYGTDIFEFADGSKEFQLAENYKKGATAVACTLTDISVTDARKQKVAVLEYDEVIRPRQRLSVQFKNDNCVERSAKTQ